MSIDLVYEWQQLYCTEAAAVGIFVVYIFVVDIFFEIHFVDISVVDIFVVDIRRPRTVAVMTCASATHVKFPKRCCRWPRMVFQQQQQSTNNKCIVAMQNLSIVQ